MENIIFTKYEILPNKLQIKLPSDKIEKFHFSYLMFLEFKKNC